MNLDAEWKPSRLDKAREATSRRGSDRLEAVPPPLSAVRRPMGDATTSPSPNVLNPAARSVLVAERSPRACPGSTSLAESIGEPPGGWNGGCIRMPVRAVGPTVGVERRVGADLTRLESELASVSDRVGDAGSPTDIERVVLGDGSSAVIGSLAAGGEGSIASWFGGVVAETHYARLFAFLEQLSRRTQSGRSHHGTPCAHYREPRF